MEFCQQHIFLTLNALIEWNDQLNYLLPIVRDIATAEIPLKILCVSLIGERTPEQDVDQLAVEISKLKSLETLKIMSFPYWPILLINQICFSELSKLDLRVAVILTAEQIMDIVQVAEKMQALTISSLKPSESVEKTSIDANNLKKLTEIVEKRAKKTRLFISLDQNLYSVNMSDGWKRVQKDAYTKYTYYKCELP